MNDDDINDNILIVINILRASNVNSNDQDTILNIIYGLHTQPTPKKGPKSPKKDPSSPKKGSAGQQERKSFNPTPTPNPRNDAFSITLRPTQNPSKQTPTQNPLKTPTKSPVIFG